MEPVLVFSFPLKPVSQGKQSKKAYEINEGMMAPILTCFGNTVNGDLPGQSQESSGRIFILMHTFVL